MLMMSRRRSTLSLNPKKSRLNLLQWLAAFEAYALAVDFAKQWSAVEACMGSVQMYACACLAEMHWHLECVLWASSEFA